MKASLVAILILLSGVSLRAQGTISPRDSIYLAGWPVENENEFPFNLLSNTQLTSSPLGVLFVDFLSLFDRPGNYQPPLQLIEPTTPPPELIPPILTQPPPIVIQPIQPIILQYPPSPVQIIDPEPPGGVIITIGVIDTTYSAPSPPILAPTDPVLTFGSAVEPAPEPSTCFLVAVALGLLALKRSVQKRQA